MLNAMTVDVEDYYHVTAFEGQVSRRHWDEYPSRVVGNTRLVLRLLDRYQVRATFFVLGWVGHRFPGLVRDISRSGHDVGCHGYWHRLIYQQTPDEFRQDLRLARTVLEQAAGRPVTAYRAPTYSITRQTLWALDILTAEGFRYDSSIFPIYHDRYGIPEARRFPYRISSAGGELWEFPPSTVRWWKVNVPVAGGGYFRLYPVRWTAYCLGRINRLGQPFVFCVHPWELDPRQPRLPGAYWTRWRHYLNLASTRRKLEWLLRRFRFGRLSDSLAQGLGSANGITPHDQTRHPVPDAPGALPAGQGGPHPHVPPAPVPLPPGPHLFGLPGRRAGGRGGDGRPAALL